MIHIKSESQIEQMKAAGALSKAALRRAGAMVKPGVSTQEIDSVVEGFIRLHGAVPTFKGYGGFPASICSSVNEQIVHGIPGERGLRAGDLVSIDCGAIVAGWHGDAAVTVIVGGVEAARPEDLALSRATEDSLYAGIAALRVGERLYAVGEAVEACIEAAAAANGQTYGIVEDYVGHTIGTEMHQDPQIFNYAVRTRGPMVRSGYTGAIEPMITLGSAESDVLADGWTVVTSDGSRAAHWEHTVAVRDEGLWVLTAIDGGAARLAALGAAFAPLSD